MQLCTRGAEHPGCERVGLVPEDDPREVQIGVRRRHVPMACPRHERERRFAGCGAVRERAVPEVVERTNVVLDPGGLQRRPERPREPLVIELRAPCRMAEDELVFALER